MLSSNWLSPEYDFYKSILLIIAEGSFYKHKFLIYSFVILISLGKFVIKRLFYYNLEYGFSLALWSSARYSSGCFYLAISSVISIFFLKKSKSEGLAPFISGSKDDLLKLL